jgi:hypothetical protein
MALALIACSSGTRTPVAAGDSTQVTSASSAGPSNGSTFAGTASAAPASTASIEPPNPSNEPPTTAEPTTTTTTPPPLRLDGSGARGLVTAGPTCPVERPDQPCPPNPVRGRVDAIDSAGPTAGTATTDDAGRYAIALAPGDYTLHVDADGQFPRCPDTHVTVAAGGPATVDISCDTGIR